VQGEGGEGEQDAQEAAVLVLLGEVVGVLSRCELGSLVVVVVVVVV